MINDDQIPDSWQWVRCGDVIDVRDGTHDTPKKLPEGIPLITSKNLNAGGIDFSNVTFISEQDHREIEKRSGVDDGDVLFAMIGTIGNPVVVKKDRPFSIKNVALFKLANSGVDPAFFKLLLGSSTILQQVNRNAKGGNQKFVSLKVLRGLQIPLPPLPEQRRIAAILDKADAIRRKRQKAIELTEEFLKSAFLEMFGDPVTNPKGWESVELSKLVRDGDKINYGVVQPGPDVEGGVPIVRVGDFAGFGVDQSGLKRIAPEVEEGYKRSRLVGDEVLVACVGSIGLAVLVDESLRNANIVRAVARIRCGERINRLFLCSLLHTPAVQAYFSKETRTVSQPTLNIKQIEQTSIIVPPIERQQEFAALFTRLNATKKRISGHEARLASLFDSLVQRAFRGELSLAEATG